MDRSQTKAVLQRNLPFTRRMADGKEYHLSHRDYLSLPLRGAFVAVYDGVGHHYVLPLRAITGLNCPAGAADTRETSAS